MKNLVALCMALMFFFSTSAGADTKKVIEISQLPAAAQQLIGEHYGKHTVLLVVAERDYGKKKYEVTFDNGDYIEFDKSGNWKEIGSKSSVVPLALIPKEIWQQIRMKYPKTAVKKIEKDRRGYDVELTNMAELTFDRKYRLTDIDVD